MITLSPFGYIHLDNLHAKSQCVKFMGGKKEEVEVWCHTTSPGTTRKALWWLPSVTSLGGKNMFTCSSPPPLLGFYFFLLNT